MSQLFLSNVPWDCPEPELRQWIESMGFPVDFIHIIRDLVANVSPAFAYVTLHDTAQNESAIKALNGRKLKDTILLVKEDWRQSRQGGDGIGPSETRG